MNSNQKTLAIVGTIAIVTLAILIIVQQNLHNKEIRKMAQDFDESKSKSQKDIIEKEKEISTLNAIVQKIQKEKVFKAAHGPLKTAVA
ncbi:MAG: hypothetical protein HWE22_17665 [Flavobacteriales bacterium]|nr:hypothetical protein [Flavobacteriales bacterium]